MAASKSPPSGQSPAAPPAPLAKRHRYAPPRRCSSAPVASWHPQ